MKSWVKTLSVAVAAVAVSLTGCKKAEPKKEEPKKVEPAKAAEPKKEEPKKEEPKAGEPKKEEPKAEPKKEEPKAAEPKKEEPKAPAAAGNLEVIKKYFAALDAGNPDWTLYAADAEVTFVGSPMPPAKGIEAVKASMGPLGKAFSGMKHGLARIYDGGDTVVVQGVMNGKNTGEFMGKPATNKDCGMEFATVYTFAGGKIAKSQIYGDMATLMAQMGMIPNRPAPAVPALPATTEVVKVAPNEARLKEYNEGGEAMGKNDMAWFDARMDANVEMVDHAMGMRLKGMEAWKKGVSEWKAGFPESKMASTSVWTAGDYVVATGVWSGKNTGDMGEIKATNKEAKIDYLHVLKYANGKVVWDEMYSSSMQFAMQLGLMDAPKAPEGGAAPAGDKPAGDKAAAPEGDKPAAPAGDKAAAPAGDKPAGDKPAAPASK